jgi:putative glycosyltransferase
VIELSRNFGHHKAIMTGLSHANGEFVFLIDADLEEEPELLGRFWQELQNSDNIDVVYGVQESRKGGWFERWSGELFYQIYNYLNEIKIPNNMVTARLMSATYVHALCKHKEIELCFGCILMNTGFQQKEIYILKKNFSLTTYTLSKKISLMFTSIISFTSKPLIMIFHTGVIITLFSFIYILYLLFNKIINGALISGWTSVMVSVWFFGGIIMLSLGIIGIYLSKIFIETKRRPYTTIKKTYGEKND